MSKHTPGPWVAVRADMHGDPDDPDDDRWSVCVGGPTQYFIATVENGAPGDSLETEAFNAHLIAAAPDYHEAVRGLLELWPLSGHELEAYMDATFLPAVRAAINKAEGK